MKTVADVLKLAQNREHKKKAAIDKRRKDQDRRYSVLVHECHAGTCQLSPEAVCDELESCGRTAQQLHDDMEILAARQQCEARVAAFNGQERRQKLKQRREDLAAAFRKAEEEYEAGRLECDDEQREIDRTQKEIERAEVYLNRTNDKVVPSPDEYEAISRGEAIERKVYARETVIGPGGSVTVKAR